MFTTLNSVAILNFTLPHYFCYVNFLQIEIEIWKRPDYSREMLTNIEICFCIRVTFINLEKTSITKNGTTCFIVQASEKNVFLCNEKSTKTIELVVASNLMEPIRLKMLFYVLCLLWSFGLLIQQFTSTVPFNFLLYQ